MPKEASRPERSHCSRTCWILRWAFLRLEQQDDDGYDNGYYRVARHADGGISPGTLSLFPDVLALTAIHPYRYFTDSVMLLMVEAFVTVSHLMLDIQWQEIVFIGGVAYSHLLDCFSSTIGPVRYNLVVSIIE